MKIILKEPLKLRLECAAYNGSVIAKDILNEINTKTHSEAISGKHNYFTSKVYKSGFEKTISISEFSKDINNKNFPEYKNKIAVWKQKYRNEITPKTFLSYFKNLKNKYTNEQINYFNSAINVKNKLFVRIYESEEDFYRAYNESNYYPYCDDSDNAPLLNSCMRYEKVSEICANYYTNCANNKIMIVQDIEGNIYGRALVWFNCIVQHDKTTTSFVDRIYYNYSFIRTLMINYAKSSGIILRKTKNDYCSTRNFTILSSDEEIVLNLYRPLRNSKLYKGGTPYHDTFKYIRLYNGKIYLSNYKSKNVLLDVQCTDSDSLIKKEMCPVCNRLVYSESFHNSLCDKCISKYYQFDGSYYIPKFSFMEYNNKLVPSLLLKKDGSPNIKFKNFIFQATLSKSDIL